MLNKLLIALGLRKRPQRSRLTMWTYDDNDDNITNNKALTKLLQVGDAWHQYFTDSMGRKVHCEYRWWGPDDGWHLHNWKIDGNVPHTSD